MRRLLGMTLVLAALMSLVILPTSAQQPETEPPRILQVVDAEPLSGGEVGLEEPVVVYFDREIDCATVADAVTITPSVDGTVACNDATSLVFTPEGYDPATDYTLSISPTLLGADGAQLLDTYALEFNSLGYLRVGETFPNDGAADVEPDTSITVIFNRPVVPLVMAEDMADLPNPLVFDTPLSGTGEWLNTSIYVFTPDTPLAGGVQYNARVREGLTSVDGAVLPEAYTFSFTTQAPRVVEVVPGPETGKVRLNRSVEAIFNQPMDRASVEAAFSLQYAARTDTAVALFDTSVSGTFEWNPDSTGFAFAPDDDLQLATLYRASIGEGARAAAGGADIEGTTEWFFSTVPSPSITGTEPSNNQQNAWPYGGIVIYFASPMDEESLEDKVTIDPEPWREPEYFYRYWDDSLSVSFPTEPSTQYTITVEAGMADEYGNTIDRPYTFTYTTAPYDPSLQLNTPGSVGFYNAYREPTQLFLTHRNVSEVNLALYDMPLDVFGLRLLGPNYYDPASEYEPSSERLIRQWTIPSRAPQNALRYELLNFGQRGSGDFSCGDAPPSRVQVGDMAMVITEPDPLRVRETPTGGVIELIYRGYSLPIIGGPDCQNGYVWWQVRLRDDRTGWVAEGDPEEYFINLRDAAQNDNVTVADEDGGQLDPGVYYLRASAPNISNRYQQPAHFMVVSTAVLTMKASVDEVVVWATDVQSGDVLANVPVTVYDSTFRVVANGLTNEQGVFQSATARVDDLYVRRMAVVDDGTNFGIASTEWTNGLEPWQFGQNYDFYPRNYRAYMYTDRPVYRPGQPVYYRGIVRQKDDVDYYPVQDVPVLVTVYDDRREVILSDTPTLTPYGSFSGELMLDDEAGLGYYYIDVAIGYELEQETYGVGFSVAEYRLPEFQVEVTAADSEIVQGDSTSISVESTYFFGGAVSGAEVDYSVVASPYSFNYQGEGYYDFQDFDYDGGPSSYYGAGGSQLVADGDVVADGQGVATFDVMGSLEDSTTGQTYSIEVVVNDESNQTVAGRTSITVHKGLVYVGVRPERYVSTANEATNIEIITVDWDSNPVPNQAVDIDVIERRWSSVQEQDENGRTIWTWEVEEIPVTTGDVVTDADGDGVFTFTPPNGGVYKITVMTRDELGNDVVASTNMWVSSREYVSWRQQNSNRIDLITDQDDYSVGDTAEILITSPFQGEAEALVTVERGDVLVAERVRLTSNSYIYELPITADFAPNIYVSVFIVKGVDDNNPVAGFRAGYVQLGVDVERKEIDIDITSDVDRAAPQETVTYTVRTTDYAGQPVSAEVGVAVTDLASLSLANPNQQPLMQFFYGTQGLGVRTASGLTINTDQLTQEVLDTIKGGGGGFLAEGLVEIRGEFVDTPYWNGSIVTGEDGTATFDVRLPDNLTTWRLDARAVTLAADGNMLVGQDTFDLLSTKPLIIRPVTPRFFVIGDEVVLSAVVNNNTESDQEVVVTLDSTGLTVLSDAAQVITIPANGRGRVTWDVVVDETDNAVLTFTADAGNFSDGSISPVSLDDMGTLPVYRYEVPETVGTAGILRSTDVRVESVVLPRRFDVTQGELTIRAEHSLAATSLTALDVVRRYPYESIETTASRLITNAMTLRAVRALPVSADQLDASLASDVMLALQRLYAHQKSDGGWGWYLRDTSDVMVTAYALLALTEVRDVGFDVPQSVIQNAQGFLSRNYIVPQLDTPEWRLNRQAFVLYVMARSGAADVARTTNLYESRERLSVFAQGLLAQTLYAINPNDSARLDTMVNLLVNNAVVSATGIHWQEDYEDRFNWNTDVRATAIALDTLILLRPESDLLPNVVRYLMVQRDADAWETLQETAWVVQALTDWMVLTDELAPDYQYNIALNGDKLLSEAVSAQDVFEDRELVVDVAELLRDQANLILFNRVGNEGALYYTAHLNLYLPVPEVEALDRGIIINRRYVRPDDADQTPIDTAQVGELIEVRLTIIAPNDLHYVVVDDPLPAGAEGVDPNLETSQQIGTRPGLDNDDPLRRGWGWWWFSNIEFRDERVVLSSTYLPAGTYEYVYYIRAGVPGTYNVIPATGQEVYFPEVYGRSAGMTFTVLPD